MVIGNGDVIWTVAILCLYPFYFSVKCLLQKNLNKTQKPNNNQKTKQQQNPRKKSNSCFTN